MPRGRPRKSADDVLVKSAELIGWALGGIEREIAQTRERLGALTAHAAQLRRQSEGKGGQTVHATGAEARAGGSRRRRMSAEGRKRIADAARRRWAKWRAEHKNR